jgi:hypothetical protein
MTKFLLAALFLLNSCGTAKTTYIETAYKLCADACELKYSRYQGQKLNSCKLRCSEKRRNNSK